MEMMAAKNSNEEETLAIRDVIKCIFHFTEFTVLRSVIQLGIPDIVENHPGSIVSLAELSNSSGSLPSLLHRVMRFLTRRGIFKEMTMDGQDSSIIGYAHTPYSRALTKDRMAHLFLLMSSPEIVSSKLSFAKVLASNTDYSNGFEAAHGVDLWKYSTANPLFGELFAKGMDCLVGNRLSLVLENYPDMFEGIGCLVDVGGGNGTALRMLVKACPWIVRAINFDLPHVVALSGGGDDGRVEHIGGDMFVDIPCGDAIFIKSVLHDWDDEACVKILKNCKDALSKETGKLIIMDSVVNHDNLKNIDNYEEYHLAADIEMLALTINGKERNAKEWDDVLKSAGFSKHTIKYIPAPISVIEVYL
ncbi:acetylserotonin O-methyltransferase-like [Andrographis paniculata]|uniref:acetylserotonin O-methyltransferase-like n=1 Tax=Andrographis paniculata TaxID=175694 RepID=UPI0021E936B3|nr:acetylserotonin O-methyltransferase-like [Andrographis paniculata]